MRQMSSLIVFGTLASVLVATAPLLALEGSTEAGCVSTAELEGSSLALTPEAAVGGLSAHFSNIARNMADPADAERMTLIAIAAGIATPRGDEDGRLLFGVTDANGNPSAEFGVQQTEDGSWQAVSLAIHLPQRICNALADRL